MVSVKLQLTCGNYELKLVLRGVEQEAERDFELEAVLVELVGGPTPHKAIEALGAVLPLKHCLPIEGRLVEEFSFLSII